MRARINSEKLSGQKVDLAACFAYENDKRPRGLEGDPALAAALAARMKQQKFKGSAGEIVHWDADGAFACSRFVVIGLGIAPEAPGEAARIGAARAAREASSVAAGKLAIRLAPESEGRMPLEVRAAVEGAMLGDYRFERHLTDPSRKKSRLGLVVVSAAGSPARNRAAAKRGEVSAQAVCLARDLVNEGPSRMTPVAMARVAAREAKAHGLRCKILGPAELRKLGMTSLLSVSRGSKEPPRVVHLTYRPARGRSAKRIVLVGKGVTFDSGGLNLKPAESMRDMKSDMAGAAAVLATMTALKESGCRAEVHGILGLSENMTGGAAYKPGDILDTYAGKTVEVGNTDAEGRLVLCDLLAWAADKLAPTCMVDVATLTGAVVVALGLGATGLFTRDEKLRGELPDAGAVAGERVWQLPMYEEYLAQLQKGPADLCNIGGRWGGAITAALFLGEFVPRELPWAHLDIAGPAFAETDQPDSTEGGTGAGVRTLTRWLETV